MSSIVSIRCAAAGGPRAGAHERTARAAAQVVRRDGVASGNASSGTLRAAWSSAGAPAAAALWARLASHERPAVVSCSWALASAAVARWLRTPSRGPRWQSPALHGFVCSTLEPEGQVLFVKERERIGLLDDALAMQEAAPRGWPLHAYERRRHGQRMGIRLPRRARRGARA